ncbi:hypothetical protein [Microbulbifer sp. M83]|uniref:hypothetical protein n=1 Tax=Microbulbifer sp. M83 TaxID=3118246 RepID=UPI002FE2C2B4
MISIDIDTAPAVAGTERKHRVPPRRPQKAELELYFQNVTRAATGSSQILEQEFAAPQPLVERHRLAGGAGLIFLNPGCDSIGKLLSLRTSNNCVK